MLKYTSFFFILLFLNNLASAQTPRMGGSAVDAKWYQDGWVVNAHVGSRAFGKVSDTVNEAPALSLNAGLGYAFDKWSIIGRVDYYNHFLIPGYKGGRETITRSFGMSLIGNFHLIPLFTGEMNKPWQFDAYVGAGLTTSWNKDMQNYVNDNVGEFNDPFIAGNDDMGHIILGFSPKYYFNDQVALSLDMSSFILFSQDFTYDYTERITGDGLGGILTFSFGVVIKPKF